MKSRPSPGICLANSSDISPWTSEKLTPAFSKTPPSARTRDPAAAAALALPGVLAEAAAPSSASRPRHDAVLEVAEIGDGAVAHGVCPGVNRATNGGTITIV